MAKKHNAPAKPALEPNEANTKYQRLRRRHIYIFNPEEDTADNHPQQRRRPAEHRRNDGTGHGTGTRN